MKPLSRFAIVLEQLDHFGPIMDLVRLVKGQSELTADSASSDETSDDDRKGSPGPLPTTKSFVSLAAFRLVALTERTSALLHAASPIPSLLRADALSSLLRSFAAGLGIPVSSRLNILSEEQYSFQVSKWVEEEQSEMVVIPWSLEAQDGSGEGKGKEVQEVDGGLIEQYIRNPLEGLFGLNEAKGARGRSGGEAASYATFARRVFAEGESHRPTCSAPFRLLMLSDSDSALQRFAVPRDCPIDRRLERFAPNLQLAHLPPLPWRIG